EEGNEKVIKTKKYKQTAALYGLSVTSDSLLAIDSNHHEVKKILERGRGYHRQFWRHDKMTDKNKAVFIAGKTRRCVLLDIFGDKKVPF
ncbi:hypothetical protein KAH94_04590, partial [bacterium]|nr:hypothetical protein [bacterium]